MSSVPWKFLRWSGTCNSSNDCRHYDDGLVFLSLGLYMLYPLFGLEPKIKRPPFFSFRNDDLVSSLKEKHTPKKRKELSLFFFITAGILYYVHSDADSDPYDG